MTEFDNTTYNESQLQAITSSDSNIVVVAPPGAGKTRTIVGAIQYYLQQHPTHSVAAITFTKKAAAELEERIRNKRVHVSTIHSWAYTQLRKLGKKYEFEVSLLDEDDCKKILTTLCRQLGYYTLNVNQLYFYITSSIRNIDLDNRIRAMYERVRSSYSRYKQLNHLYDFMDLPAYLLEMLDMYNETITDFNAFFVDEFQDVDETQFKIFERVAAMKKFYVGDFKQSIYIFRDALTDVFDRLPTFTTYMLDTNYRSKQNILDVADSVRDVFAANLQEENEMPLGYDPTPSMVCLEEDMFNSPVSCIRGEGGQVVTIADQYNAFEVDTEHRSSLNSLTFMRQLLADPHTQILCRANSQVKKLTTLGFKNASTVHQAKGLEYDNVVVCDFPITNLEEMNIAYVAMTRAKNTLCLTPFTTLIQMISIGNLTTSTGKDKLF